MESKIIVTSPHPQFTALANEISAESGIEIIVVEAVLDDACALVAEICSKRDIVVILSRGGTALAISNCVDVPVISIETNDFDILMALWEARKRPGKIAYLGFDFKSAPYEFDSLFDIIGFEVRQYAFVDHEGMKRQILSARDEGIGVIVSGSSEAMTLAAAAGLEGVLVKTGRRTMYNALRRAAEIVELRENDRKKSLQLETMLNLYREGVIVLDKTGAVNLINRTAESLIGKRRDALMGRRLAERLSKGGLSHILENSGEASEKVISIEGRNVIVNKISIVSDREYYGDVITLQEAAKIELLEHSVRRQLHSKGLIARTLFEEIVGDSASMRKCIERSRKFAQTDGTVLITGESGTGKEMIAQGIHNYSRRRTYPFVAVNCAALPENLLESELFGYEEGAFTGAKKGGKPGLFELAHKGTLFLDELSSIPLKTQVQLLRVLQERQVFRIGGDRVIPVDVRIVAATNEELGEVVKSGKFRFDLFYRLNVLNVDIPPLRERPEDIPQLVAHFVASLSAAHRKEVREVSAGLMELFLSYGWPGNIRELMNCVECMVIVAEGELLDVDALGANALRDLGAARRGADAPEIAPPDADGGSFSVARGTLRDIERQVIRGYYERFGGNQSRMARELGLCRTTLWKKMKLMGLAGSE